MIPFHDDIARRSPVILVAGVAAVVISTAIGAVRSFSMTGRRMADGMTLGNAAPHALHGMPIGEMPEMWVAALGLVLVVAGSLVAGRDQVAADGPSRPCRRAVGVVGFLGLTIDISKTSTLGFVIPGMRGEYALDARTASLLAVFGLAGTAVGAVVLGSLSDWIGRRRTYLIATLGFTATSMCGSMPTFVGNLVMCALMGIAVGGLAPLLVTVLADSFGTRQRRAALLGLSVVATAIGYLVAAGSALWLEPLFGWRVLWLIGMPTGILLVVLTRWVPARPPRTEGVATPPSALDIRTLSRTTQLAYAFLVGLMTFGLTTWVPSLARNGGVGVERSNLLLTVAALMMVPCALVVVAAYRRFGPTTLLVALTAGTAVVLLVLTASGIAASVQWLTAIVLVACLFAVNTMAAVFLPVSADLAVPSRRGRTTGRVSLANRVGGFCGPLVLAGLVTSAIDVLWAVSVLAVFAAAAAIAIAIRRRGSRRAVGDDDHEVATQQRATAG